MSIKSAADINSGSWGSPFRVRGADGTSITIKGSKTDVSELPVDDNNPGDAYIIGESLYIWDGVRWTNVGKIKGEDGKSSFLHIKYSDDGGETFTDGNGEVPGRWMGILVNQSQSDSDNPADYTWNDTKGEDGTPGKPGEDGKTSYIHIKYSDNGGLSSNEVIDRNNIMLTQTPQAFSLKLISELHDEAILNKKCDLTATCTIMASLNRSVYFSKGDGINIKLTTPADLVLLKSLISNLRLIDNDKF